jgi:polyisoprenoid-binding protein YceI
MRVSKMILTVASSLLLSSAAWSATWTIDSAHSTGSFRVRHLMVTNVNGTIHSVEGSVDLDEKDITKSKVNATLDATTINTNEPKRDKHLRSADFFDTDKFPKITFVSKSVKSIGKGQLKVSGDLTMRGVTKEVVLDVDGPTDAIKGMNNDWRRGVTATTTINRKDFGVNWNKALDGGGVVVGDEIKITLDVELVSKDKPAH